MKRFKLIWKLLFNIKKLDGDELKCALDLMEESPKCKVVRKANSYTLVSFLIKFNRRVISNANNKPILSVVKK